MKESEKINFALTTRRAAQQSHRRLACPRPCPECGRFLYQEQGIVYYHGRRHHAACFLDATRGLAPHPGDRQ